VKSPLLADLSLQPGGFSYINSSLRKSVINETAPESQGLSAESMEHGAESKRQKINSARGQC